MDGILLDYTGTTNAPGYAEYEASGSFTISFPISSPEPLRTIGLVITRVGASSTGPFGTTAAIAQLSFNAPPTPSTPPANTPSGGVDSASHFKWLAYGGIVLLVFLIVLIIALAWRRQQKITTR